MIQSMTAYARQEANVNDFNLICEIRSINHRYLEMNVYLPENLRRLEMAIRDKIKENLGRGKVECALRVSAAQNDRGSVKINATLAEEMCHLSEKIAEQLQSPGLISPTDILRIPGVLEQPEMDFTALQAQILTLVQNTLNELVEVRQREGNALNNLFLDRLHQMADEIEKVKKTAPEILQEQREKLMNRLSELQVDLDAARLEQEMVYYAQKIDVLEEVDRLETHIKEIKRVLKKGGVVGRRLDFLLQELNREANTLGSKSLESTLTHAAVELKVLIEQFREQVQNIE